MDLSMKVEAGSRRKRREIKIGSTRRARNFELTELQRLMLALQASQLSHKILNLSDILPVPALE